MDSLSIDSVNGLPPGMTATCDNPGCIWPGGGNGCIDLTGTPSSLGVYEITAYSATRLVFGAILDSTVVTPFIFKLSVVNNIGLADQPSQDFVLQPNPASEVVSIQFSEPLASKRSYVLVGCPREKGRCRRDPSIFCHTFTVHRRAEKWALPTSDL